jgi:hypothetical protein
MDQKKMTKITSDLQSKYPEVGIKAISVDEKTGQSTFFLDPKPKTLAFLEHGGVIPKGLSPGMREKAAVVTRDTMDRTFLDLAQIHAKYPMQQTPKERIENAISYYHTVPELGSTVNLLAGLASKGFEHDIDDEQIKNFFDVWAFDVKFYELLDWIFLDFFKYGHVTTYKVLAKYEPRVSHLSPIPGQKIKTTKKTKATGKDLKDAAAKKSIWSKGHLPVAYTVLNPVLVNIEGNLLFDKVSVKLTPPPELTELLAKPTAELTEEEKALIKALPSDLKAAAEDGGEFQLDSRLVGFVTYRKMPYERYAAPRSLKIFDSIEYKKTLRQADMSTLDGITNYILKITIGNDEYPVVTQEELEAVSQLFNTPGKSFDVIWNHTLQVEKIVSPEIEAILGQEKYSQVNEDISAGLAMSRAFIDGTGDLNVAGAQMIIKGVQEEIDYARRQVTRWIYNEYQQIAEAMGFERFPKVRWDEGILKDTIMYMNIISQLVDRRMLSYETALEQVGFDYDNELANMEEEMPLVEAGILGILGSPWQQTAQSGGPAGTQNTQKAPKGTPSGGRPKGKPATKKTPQSPAKKNQTKTKKTTKPQASPAQKTASIQEIVKDMSDVDFADFTHELAKLRIEENPDG